MPVMPSATCELKRPDSYVWQPKVQRTGATLPVAAAANHTWSETMRPRMVEPSVYETE